MAAPPSRGKLDGNAARPPLRLMPEVGRPGSSPRVMLQPLQPPNSQGFSGTTASADDKEYLAQLKREIRLLAAKVAEYSAAVDTDRRMSDSSTLLRRPLTPGSANRPGTSGGLTAVGQIAGNVDTYIEKASAGKGFEQAKSGLLELLLTLLEDAHRCTLMLTDKRAPAGCTVPAPSTCSGRMGSRVPVAEALMERTMQLHGAARLADDAERTRPMTGGRRPLDEAGASVLSVDVVAVLLSRLADLHQHYGAIADGKRDAGDTLGGKLLDELDGALSAMTSACTQSGHSKLSDAAARVQGEARNATLAISTVLAIVGSGDGEEMLRLELEKVRGELMSSRMQAEAAKAQCASQVDALNKRLGKKEAEVDVLQRQVKDASQGSARQREEEEAAVAMDLMSVAKTTALEAANSELSNEVKQLKAQLQQAKAGAKAQMAAAAGAAAVGSAGPQQASSQHALSQHASSQRPPTAAASAAAARPSTSAVMGRPGTAAALSQDELRQEWLTLRGELGVARSQLASTRQDKVQLETRLRIEKEKLDEMNKVCESKDEQIAHLRSELRGLERLNSAVGNADTFEAVLAEEMHTMRESFEQKIVSLKAQIERDSAAFSRERKEMRENFDKETKAMKRQIELLQVKAGDYSQPEFVQSAQQGAETLTLDE